MKTPFTLLILLFAAVAPGLRAQSGWQMQSPSPSIYPLNAIQMLTPQSGWTCGHKGNLFHTVDGGLDWVPQPRYTRSTLNGMHFPTLSYGWIVGDSGVILYTSSHGVGWARQNSGTDSALMAVHFADEEYGWAAGRHGVLLHTTNGGQIWAAQASGTIQNLYAVAFANRNIGWAVGDSNTLLHTTNGGQAWAPQTSAIAWPYRLSALHVVDAARAWIAGFGGTVMKTANGGQTWTISPTGTTTDFRDIAFVGDTGWAVGGYGIYRTLNNGINWQTRSASFLGGYMNAIYPMSGTTARYVGDGGRVVLCRNGFLDLALEDVPTTNHLNNLHFLDDRRGLACGFFGRLCRTTDGGLTWRLQPFNTTNELFAIQWVNAAEAWTGGVPRGLRHSTDSGKTWATDSASYRLGVAGVSAVRFVNADTGWAGLESGKIYKTTNRGQTWTEQTSGTFNKITGFYFRNGQRGWATSEGRVLYTANGGQTWAGQYSSNGEVFRGIDVPDGLHGIVGLSNTGISGLNAVLVTSDGGVNWSLKNLFAEGDLLAVKWINNTAMWLVTSQEKIYQSTDGGDTWNLLHNFRDAINYTLIGRSAMIRDTGNVWFCGENGALVRYGSVLVTSAKPVSAAEPTASLITPNPSQGIFTLKLEKPARIEVSTTDGRRVQSLPAQPAGIVILSLAGQPKGLYLIHLVGIDGRREVRKVVLN